MCTFSTHISWRLFHGDALRAFSADTYKCVPAGTINLVDVCVYGKFWVASKEAPIPLYVLAPGSCEPGYYLGRCSAAPSLDTLSINDSQRNRMLCSSFSRYLRCMYASSYAMRLKSSGGAFAGIAWRASARNTDG
jgi:hypothetical protein